MTPGSVRELPPDNTEELLAGKRYWWLDEEDEPGDGGSDAPSPEPARPAGFEEAAWGGQVAKLTTPQGQSVTIAVSSEPAGDSFDAARDAKAGARAHAVLAVRWVLRAVGCIVAAAALSLAVTAWVNGVPLQEAVGILAGHMPGAPLIR